MNHWLNIRVTGLRGSGVVSCLIATVLALTMQVAVAAPDANVDLGSRQQDALATCSLEPLTLPLFNATPPDEVSGVTASPEASPAVLSTRPASADEIASVQSGLNVIQACINTGDPLLVYAVFSDRYLASQYADPLVSYLPALEQQLDGPTLPVNPPFAFEPVADVGMLADGRVQLTLTVRQGTHSWTNSLVLVYQNDEWLIDEVIS